jgi:methionyl-tRNA formyltransferase
MKILFFGTSEFALKPLEALVNTHHEIAGVITTPDRAGKRGKKLIESPIKTLAKLHSLYVYQPEKLKDEDVYNKIKEFNADIFVVVSYGKFLPHSILELPKFKINIHPSLLPKYRGPSPINYALLNGEKYTGVSIIDVSDEMDAGDIYMQWVEKIQAKDNYETLHYKLSQIGSKMIVCAADGIENGSIKPKKQDNSKATYTKIIDKKDGKIDFNTMDAATIVNMVKAYYGWPSAYFTYKSKIFKIYDAEAVDMDSKPSEVLDVSKNRLVIGCKEKAISIKKIQPESKKPMEIKAFLAGYKFEIGEIIK